ncbi:MAG: DUF3576 domain-containing protein [Paracoccaceae bacterium]
MAPKSTSKTIAGGFAGIPFKTAARLAAIAAVAGLASACGDGNYAADDPVGPRPGPKRQYDPAYDESIFGEGGVAIGNLRSGRASGVLGGGDEKARLPVNKYLWQGALDTLSFLPLASSDPFTGVIATEWGSTPEAPGERFKVTAYILNPGLTAAALKVAVYRELRNEEGIWTPAPVSADTARQLEDAILSRARQIRIAEREGRSTG